MAGKIINTDVLVCGGGCAGLAAALSAARSGAKTLLVERAGFAGGIITTVGLPFFDGSIDKKSGRFVVKGIALELLTALGVAKPGARGIDDCRPEQITRYWMSVRIPNIEEMKLLADQLLTREPNVSVLYHSVACGVELKNGRIDTVQIANKDGLTQVKPLQVVDCTGDADIAAWAGCPMEAANAFPTMPMTMHFRIGNVKPQKETNRVAKQLLIEAHERGELPAFYGPGLLFVFAPDEAYIHATRVTGDATSAADFTRAEMQGRRDAMTMFKLWKAKAPGFEESYYIESGPYIGVRDSRRIDGQYMLTADDLHSGRRHDDAIATGCWFMDIHSQKTAIDKPFAGSGFQPDPYDISYRTLLPKGVANLLVAGRCHSVTQEAASSSRVTATAMALGEAAGCAAAMAARSRVDSAELPGVKVREQLAKQNAGPNTDG